MSNTLRWKIAQHAEINWWKRYLRTKPVDDYLEWKKAYWKNFLKEIDWELFYKPKSKILEIGCGPAGIFTILNNEDVTAIDPLLQKYQEAIEHFDMESYSNVRFMQQNIEDFSGREYDIVFCINVINHVDEIDKAIHQIQKSVKVGGRLILSIDVHNSSWLKKIFRALQFDILHPHQYDLSEYEAMVSENFEIEMSKRLKSRKIFDYFVLKCVRVN